MPWQTRERVFFFSIHMSIVLTENRKRNSGPHRPIYRYCRVTGFAGVIHPIIVRRRHDGNGTVSVVLEQFLRLSGFLLVCNNVRAYREINSTCHLLLLLVVKLTTFFWFSLFFTFHITWEFQECGIVNSSCHLLLSHSNDINHFNHYYLIIIICCL